MKANRAQVERTLKKPLPETRLVLLHGPDEAGSRSFIIMLADALGPDADRVDLGGADLKADPARLIDEAASLSLFGGARYIVVEPAGDECVPAMEALIEAPAAGNMVLAIAGALRPTSRLLKLALASPAAMALANYVPDGRDADKLVQNIARGYGLDMRSDVARRIADATAGNRALIAQELEKFALYADASPERPRQIDHDFIDAIGASIDEGDLSRLVDSVSGGNAEMLHAELFRLKSGGIEGIPLLRAMLRRMSLLARLRAEIDRGSSVSAVMAAQGKGLFWKEKDAIASQVERWRSDLIAIGISRLVHAERDVKASGGLGTLALDEELFTICRQATRLR